MVEWQVMTVAGLPTLQMSPSARPLATYPPTAKLPAQPHLPTCQPPTCFPTDPTCRPPPPTPHLQPLEAGIEHQVLPRRQAAPQEVVLVADAHQPVYLSHAAPDVQPLHPGRACRAVLRVGEDSK